MGGGWGALRACGIGAEAIRVQPVNHCGEMEMNDGKEVGEGTADFDDGPQAQARHLAATWIK